MLTQWRMNPLALFQRSIFNDSYSETKCFSVCFSVWYRSHHIITKESCLFVTIHRISYVLSIRFMYVQVYVARPEVPLACPVVIVFISGFLFPSFINYLNTDSRTRFLSTTQRIKCGSEPTQTDQPHFIPTKKERQSDLSGLMQLLRHLWLFFFSAPRSVLVSDIYLEFISTFTSLRQTSLSHLYIIPKSFYCSLSLYL